MEVAIAILYVIGAFVPAFVWLALFTREDVHPEPKGIILKAFLFGAFGTVPALALQFGVGWVGLPVVGTLAVLLFAFIEEVTKMVAVVLGVRMNPAFDEPVDAMVYMVAAALGFATIENIFTVLSSMGSVFSVSLAVESLSLRFVGATLLHALASALVGYAWAKGIKRGGMKVGVAVGLLVGTIVHTIFNVLLTEFHSVNVLVPTVFLIGVAFFVFRDFDSIQRSR